jgi:hypothetical protein
VWKPPWTKTAQPGRRGSDFCYHTLAQAVVELCERGIQRCLVADRMAGEEAAQLQVVITQEEQPAALIDQPEHDAQRFSVVGAVVGQVAELNDEAFGCGGVGERDSVAMHVAHHTNGGVGGNEPGSHFGTSLAQRGYWQCWTPG